MNRSKAIRFSIIFAVMVVVLTCSPILHAQGETIQLMYFDFYIEPSQPPLIAEGTFNITAQDDYVFGVLEEETTGSRTSSFTYYFEMYSSAHCEVYILDSTGIFSQYSEYQTNFEGNAPTDYTYFYICDGYIQFNMTTSISPRLIIFTDGFDVTGSFFFSEGFGAIEYDPYYLRVKGGDYNTNDTLHVFNTNATVSTYLMDNDQYEDYLSTPNIRPSSSEAINSIEDVNELYLNYQTDKFTDYHILIWHEQYKEGVSGTLTYEYTFQRTFMENYWSLLVIIILLILVILFTVFRKYTLPPTVWTLEKLKKYVIEIPWREIKHYFGDIRDEFKEVMGRIRGVSEEELAEKHEISPHKRRVISLVSLAYPLSLHRFFVGKIGSAIVSIILQGLNVLFIIGAKTQIAIYQEEKLLNIEELANFVLGIIFIILFVIIILIYIIDVVSTFIGVFEDNKKRRVMK
ncbi:MAG: hypothetical protein FK730_00430 [Asgard group archaeon]|nr:hypothetical protein [Asgard group archaeon]